MIIHSLYKYPPTLIVSSNKYSIFHNNDYVIDIFEFKKNIQDMNHLYLCSRLSHRGRFERNVKEGGGVTKLASSFIYIIPSIYTGMKYLVSHRITDTYSL